MVLSLIPTAKIRVRLLKNETFYLIYCILLKIEGAVQDEVFQSTPLSKLQVRAKRICSLE